MLAADAYIVKDIGVALKTKLYPAITRWNRLEGRPRAHDFERALRAEVRDALWMICRQWQMGEFQGDDAGSPVLARACIDLVPIDRFRAGTAPAEGLLPEELLEARVERRPLPLRSGDQYLSLDLRLAVGRRWLKLLDREAAAPGGLSADYRDAYRNGYQVPVPDPTLKEHAAVCAHVETWQQAGAAAERAMDGIALLEYLEVAGHQAHDGIGAAAPDEPKLAALAGKLRDWFRSLIVQPGSPQQEAWLPAGLEYQFGCSATDGAGEQVLRAEEYYQGTLDWYALDRMPPGSRLGDAPVPPANPDRRVHTFVPTGIAYEGMPNTRWWAFEDRRTNFGDVRPDTTDLGKLLFMEFALVYANDWFVLPYTMDIGTMAEVKGIAVTNVFGERIWVEPLRSPGADWQQWGMFTLSIAGTEPAPPVARLLLLPTAARVQEGPAVEEVALIRDEMANMVWGLERRVPLPSGVSRPGNEAAREYRGYLQRLITAPVQTAPDPLAPIRYQVMNTVPEHWIPFIPVHVDNSVRETQLQRAALPRILEGDPTTPAKVRPQTMLLRQNLPQAYFIHEEEVPRAGAVVTQSYQRARWTKGEVFTWLGARKQTGRGEGSSGLRYDQIVPVQPK
ncbi:MAG: hypothetical protein ACJ8DJ_05140 [Gemmatimonadales bacterium]